MYGNGLALFLFINNVLDGKVREKIAEGTDAWYGQCCAARK